jgi:hypothetical protein
MKQAWLLLLEGPRRLPGDRTRNCQTSKSSRKPVNRNIISTKFNMKKKLSAEQTIESVEEILIDSFAPPAGYVLCLKSLPANLKAHEGFQWPEIGHVSAPDWMPTNECGNGLHAFLWGVGDSDLACADDDAKWLVMQVKEDGIIDLAGKVKFEKCEVVFCGAREVAISIIQKHAPAGTPVMYGTATAGNYGTATAGYKGTATAGNYGTATAGNYGTATAGEWGVLIIEYWNKASNEYRKKIALVDGVNYLPGVKYRLNSEYEFEQINETEA